MWKSKLKHALLKTKQKPRTRLFPHFSVTLTRLCKRKAYTWSLGKLPACGSLGLNHKLLDTLSHSHRDASDAGRKRRGSATFRAEEYAKERPINGGKTLDFSPVFKPSVRCVKVWRFQSFISFPFFVFYFFWCLLHRYFVSSRQTWCRSSFPSPSLMTAHFSVASALLTDWLTDAAHLRWFMCHRAGDQMGQTANGGRRPGRFTRRQNRPHRSAIYSLRWQDQTSAL